MTTDHTDALVNEVHDLLGTSSVGLYEFIWILRGIDPDQGDDARQAQAVGALRALLATGEGQLVLLEWPSEDVVDTYEWDRLQPTDWDDPSDGKPYVAITRN